MIFKENYEWILFPNEIKYQTHTLTLTHTIHIEELGYSTFLDTFTKYALCVKFPKIFFHRKKNWFPFYLQFFDSRSFLINLIGFVLLSIDLWFAPKIIFFQREWKTLWQFATFDYGLRICTYTDSQLLCLLLFCNFPLCMISQSVTNAFILKLKRRRHNHINTNMLI